MNRFRKYRLVFYRGRFVLTGHIIETIPIVYLVQTHKRFLGISYWKTLIKTTSYKIAKDAYDLMVSGEKIGF